MCNHIWISIWFCYWSEFDWKNYTYSVRKKVTTKCSLLTSWCVLVMSYVPVRVRPHNSFCPSANGSFDWYNLDLFWWVGNWIWNYMHAHTHMHPYTHTHTCMYFPWTYAWHLLQTALTLKNDTLNKSITFLHEQKWHGLLLKGIDSGYVVFSLFLEAFLKPQNFNRGWVTLNRNP